MKNRDAGLRASRFEVDEQRRKLVDLEVMINDFRRMATDLDAQIEAEHMRSGVRDPNHFSYPPFAKAARQRRDNLLASVADLSIKLEAARKDFGVVEEEFKRQVQASEPAEARTPRSAAGARNRSRAPAYRPSARGF
jgi:flagellar protein FliJ